MPSNEEEDKYPVLSIITIGLEPSEIIATLRPLVNKIDDQRFELIVVTPFPNIKAISNCIPAVFVPDQGEGVYQAMNLGISASSGDYLWFLNSGDKCLLTSSSFCSFLTYLSALSPDSIDGTLLFFGFQPYGLIRLFSPSFSNFLLRLFILLSIMPVSHQNILFSRFNHSPFSLRHKLSCDFEVLVKFVFLLKCNVLFASPKPIARLSAGGISDSNRLDVFRERYSILRSLTNSFLAPVIIIGFAVRCLRELVVSRIKLFIYCQ